MDGIGFETVYLSVGLTMLITIVVGLALATWHLKRVSPQLAGAAIGALVGIVLLECVPLLT